MSSVFFQVIQRKLIHVSTPTTIDGSIRPDAVHLLALNEVFHCTCTYFKGILNVWYHYRFSLMAFIPLQSSDLFLMKYISIYINLFLIAHLILMT